MLRSSKRRILIKATIIIVTVLVLFASLVLGVAYSKKNILLQEALTEMNARLEGKVAVEEVLISPFENFPYISIDLRKIEVHEDKSLNSDTVNLVEDD